MAEPFLSPGWIAALAQRGASLPQVEGIDLVVQHEIEGAPDGKVRFFLEWHSGRLERAEIGKHPDPDVMVQAKAPEALRILRRELAPEVAFMQGRLKVDGAYRTLLIDLRDWRSSPDYVAMWSAMAELTA